MARTIPLTIRLRRAAGAGELLLTGRRSLGNRHEPGRWCVTSPGRSGCDDHGSDRIVNFFTDLLHLSTFTSKNDIS